MLLEESAQYHALSLVIRRNKGCKCFIESRPLSCIEFGNLLKKTGMMKRKPKQGYILLNYGIN